MTAPGVATESIFAPQVPAGEPLSFPLDWILANASGPIKYRSATEIARLPESVVSELGSLPYAYRPALRIALTQSADGTWNRSMLTVPAKNSADFANVGTVPAVRRLIEYGFDRESPPLALARRILFRLLAEDNDPAYLYELGAKA